MSNHDFKIVVRIGVVFIILPALDRNYRLAGGGGNFFGAIGRVFAIPGVRSSFRQPTVRRKITILIDADG